MLLKGKTVILGVTGSIAAYKAALLTRLLVKNGAKVHVVMTPAAEEFVTPLTFSVLSKQPVYSRFSDAGGNWNNHVELANRADLVLIAPASANTIAKMASGICDNLLLAICLSAPCPVYLAPAMDREMYSHFTVKSNLETLKKNNITIIPASNGELASGLHGEGRMAEPEDIITLLQKVEAGTLPLSGKKALVSAGPTFEAIDPVRFIGNHSSGKMGFAIAEELARKGAKVTLIHGPVQIETLNKNITTVPVTSAAEMRKACVRVFPQSDITIMAAAVADYEPEEVERRKIKKSGRTLTLNLKPTPDILAELGSVKKEKQLLIGFALETDNEEENARLKLKKKNLDAIVLNSLQDKGTGPGSDLNRIAIMDKHNKTHKFELKPKTDVATDIVTYIIRLTKNR